MFLSDLCIKRPVLAIVLNLLIIVFGFICYHQLPLREYPDIDPPVISITTTYQGASAEIIESKITQLIENRISGIDGIKTIDSSSTEGLSTITVEFKLSKDIDSAANDVRDRVSKVAGDLPAEADPSEISKVDSNESVILWFSLSSDKLSELELTDYADRYLVDRLSIVEGVARVRIGGERRYAIRIWLDPQKLAARNLTVDDIETALRDENIELPAGRLESLDSEYILHVARLYQTPDDFRRLVISKGEDNLSLVRLGDVAQVEVGAADTRSELRGNGEVMVGLGIIKQTQANTLEVGQKIKQEIKKIRDALPENIKIYDNYDTTIFVQEAIIEVYKTLGIAIILVGIVIFLFLGRLYLTLVPMLSIPVSLVASFIALKTFGFSINILTLLGLILAIGIVVDDSIIVLENNYRRMEMGEHPTLASFRGTRQIAFAVIVTTISLLGAFIPIIFLEGITGRLFSELVTSLSFAVLVSAFTALTLSPVLSSKITMTHSSTKVYEFVNACLKIIQKFYIKVLVKAIRHPLYVLALMGCILTSIGLLFWITPAEYAPKEDRGSFFILSNGPEGASYDYMSKKMLEVEEKLMFLLEKQWATNLLVRIPRNFSSSAAVNNAISIVVLDGWSKRPTANAIIEQAQKSVMGVEGIRSFAVMRQGLQRGGIERPIQFVIGGGDFATLAKWRDIILEKTQGSEIVKNIDYDYQETKPKFLIKINKDKAASLGITSKNISRTLETLFSSRNITTYFDRGQEYDVILQSIESARETPKDFEKIYIKSSTTKKLIPLINIIDIKETADSATLNRYNRIRSITLTATLGEGKTIGEALKYLDNIAKSHLPSDAIIDYKGESLDYKDSKGGNVFIFIVALIVIYLLLAAQFESFIHPLIVMISVPFAVFGSLVGIYIMGNTINIFSQIGMVMLIGMAAKNGILIVEFINQLRDRNLSFIRAILKASQIRLRPVLMTSIAAIVGAVPLFFAFGAGAETRSAIGVVIFFGMFFTTFFTLISVPVFYFLMARHTTSPHHQARLIKTLEQGSGEKI